jgi:crossover junction endodeoxyribonuclease RuvC
MVYLGIDPGFTGAWGLINHHGNYVGCGDMNHNEKWIDINSAYREISLIRENDDMMIVVEAVHAMPKQGVSSSFKFGIAYGQALSLAQRFLVDWELVVPRVWKGDLSLTSDKTDSLNMARQRWPEAPLGRIKDNGRAEALLLAEWLRQAYC